ncbi:MAG: tRNA uridine-5-carboxymethylaminomethyl(34) synthesis GTPase MnmE, partial [Rhizobiaceae bacterium]
AKAATHGTDVAPSRERHVQFLKTALRSLNAALDGYLALELRAEELRSASEALGRITGAVDVEDLLDVVFSQFCIGK